MVSNWTLMYCQKKKSYLVTEFYTHVNHTVLLQDVDEEKGEEEVFCFVFKMVFYAQSTGAVISGREKKKKKKKKNNNNNNNTNSNNSSSSSNNNNNNSSNNNTTDRKEIAIKRH